MLLVTIDNNHKFKTDSYQKVVDWLLSSDLLSKKGVYEYVDKNNKLLENSILKALQNKKSIIITGDYIVKIGMNNGLKFEIYIKFDSVKVKIPIFECVVSVDVTDLGNYKDLQ